MIALGARVRDRVTGFEGVVIARHEYLYGCIRCSVQTPEFHEGKPVEPQTFDEPSLEVVEKVVAGHADAPERRAKQTGGPSFIPARPAVPRR